MSCVPLRSVLAERIGLAGGQRHVDAGGVQDAVGRLLPEDGLLALGQAAGQDRQGQDGDKGEQAGRVGAHGGHLLRVRAATRQTIAGRHAVFNAKGAR